MGRLPIFFVVDVSGSMECVRRSALARCAGSIMVAFKRDPYVLEYELVSVISFGAQARTIVLLTGLGSFEFLDFPGGSGSTPGPALDHLIDAFHL